MAKAPPPIVYILVGLILIGGSVYWYRQGGQLPSPSLPSLSTATDPPQPSNSFDLSDPLAGIQVTLPNPAVVEMDGSVTMVQLIKRLQNTYAQRYPNIPTTYGIPDRQPNGSSAGLTALLAGQVNMAAASRPLRPAEAEAGLRAIPIARDAVAVVVGVENEFKGGLSMAQLKDIFQGKITNWSQVGGPDRTLQVLNRAPASGTRDLFQDVVLLGEEFAPDGPSFYPFDRDVTTPILQALEDNGIGYTTVAQAENQLTVRIVPIEGISPTDQSLVQSGAYPISRFMFLVVPPEISPALKDFIDLALSSEGQQLVRQSGLIPLSS